jgi:hypothetical protein
MTPPKNKSKPPRKKSKRAAASGWHEQRVDIREHQERLRGLNGPRPGAAGWLLALAGMAALLTLLNNSF